MVGSHTTVALWVLPYRSTFFSHVINDHSSSVKKRPTEEVVLNVFDQSLPLTPGVSHEACLNPHSIDSD